MPPTVRQLFGPLHVLPPSQLADEDGIYRQLNTSGSPFEVEQRLIAGRMQTVYKNLPGSVGDFWMACAKVRRCQTDYVDDDMGTRADSIHIVRLVCCPRPCRRASHGDPTLCLKTNG